MEELVNIRQEFMATILTHLKQLGFVEVVDGYKRTVEQRTPGRTISINGQVMEQPGSLITITQSVYFIGDGWITNEDGTNKREFSQIKIEITQGDTTSSMEECYYWDEADRFINTLKLIIR
jgi:serine protease inhibitor